MTENSKYPKVRVTKQAHARLIAIMPAIRKKRGLNVSMTDYVSELILETPIPQPGEPEKPKRRVRKASAPVTASAQA